MLEPILGSRAAERTLLFLQRYGEAYARQIAVAFLMPVSQVQKQLLKLEQGGLLVSRRVGRTRVYGWNPRSIFVAPLRNLLQVALENLPPEQAEPFAGGRRRPRRAGKPG